MKSRSLPQGPLSTLKIILFSLSDPFYKSTSIYSHVYPVLWKIPVLNPAFWALNKCAVSSEGSKALLRDDKRVNETFHSSSVLSSSKPCCAQVRKLTTPLPRRSPRHSLAQGASLPAATHPSGGGALGFLSGISRDALHCLSFFH
jgi:hypothetical protein